MTFLIAGVDEAGRGPLAGAVIAATVILREPIEGITDSKKLTPAARMRLAGLIKENALAYALGRAEVEEIDRLNIHHATLLAMQRAINALTIQPAEVLVDGLYVPKINIPSRAIVKGDLLIAEIGAASILAKTARDEEMEYLDTLYPQYGFAQHKGYPTAEHRRQLILHGACIIHRKSYAPVAAALEARAMS